MSDHQQQPDRGPTQQAPPVVPPQPIPLSPLILAQLAQRGGLPYAGGPLGLPVPQIQLWQGQYPPPEAVKEYEKILPGSFNRMIRMAERLQEAQIAETERAQAYTANDSKRGHWLGFSTTIFAIAGAISCTVAGAITGASGVYWVAGTLVAVPVMAVARALIESARTSSARDLIQAATPETGGTQAPSPPTPPAGTS
jgi:uncharacterized membrane protein